MLLKIKNLIKKILNLPISYGPQLSTNNKTRSFSSLQKNKVFEELNIELQNIIDDKNVNNAYVIGHLNTLLVLNQELNKILSNTNLTPIQQQAALESLSQQSQNFGLELAYNIPHVLSQLITSLDSYLLSPGNLNSEDIQPYLPSVLAENFGSHKDLRRSNRTQEMVFIVTALKLILRTFKHSDNSFGLYLIYNLIQYLRSDLDKNLMKKIVSEQNYSNRKIRLKLADKNQITMNISRSELTTKFGENLIIFFTHMKNSCMADLQKTSLENSGYSNSEFSKLDPDKQFSKICEGLVGDPVALQLYKDLHDFKVKDVDSIRLGVHCVFILESINVLKNDGLVRKRAKTYSFVVLDSVYAHEVLSIPMRPKNLPMVIKPQPWKKTNKSSGGNLNSGGYLFNEKLNYPAIVNHHKKGITLISKEDLETINFVQSNYYQINSEFLTFIRSNFKLIVQLFFRKIPSSTTKCFFNDLDSDSNNQIIIKSIDEMFSTDPQLIENSKKYAVNNTKSLQREITNRRNSLLEQYRNVSNLFFGLVHSVIVATNFKNFQFYFNIYIDSRGRLYFHNTGACFGLQTGDFSKSLIDLMGNNYSNENPIINNCNFTKTNKFYIDYANSLSREKDPFQCLRIDQDILPTTIGLDVSCSGTSILSALIGFKKGLYLTNVIVEKTQKNLKKQCVYSYFLQKLVESYPETVLDLYTTAQIDNKIKSTNKKYQTTVSKEEFINSANFILKTIKNSFLTRENSKQFVMRKNYAETNKGRYEYIRDFIFDYKILSSSIILNQIQQHFGQSICFRLSVWVEEVYKEAFPEISELCETLPEIFANKNPINPIILSTPSQSIYGYNQFSYVTAKISRPSLDFSQRKSDLSIYLRTDMPDLSKIKRSVVANYIHYLDSRLNFLVKNKCQINSIPVWGSHDCWYVSALYGNNLKEFYYESYIELLMEENALKHFLEENKVPLCDNFKQLLETFETNRMDILSDIHKKKLIMSPFILTS